MLKELKVIDDHYKLTVYLTNRIAGFPRHHRYSLGVKIEQRLQAILEALLRCKFSSDRGKKSQLLENVNVELEVLRLQLRLTQELGALPTRAHHHALELIQLVGAQAGGWQRSLRRGPPDASPRQSLG
jgi:hypothetical protein